MAAEGDRSGGDGGEEVEEEMIVKAQKYIEMITSSSDNPNPKLLHALASLLESQEFRFGQPIKVNWAYTSGQREDTSSHFNIFNGDLSPEVTDAMLFACFSVYPSYSDARVMLDQKTGRSRGFGIPKVQSMILLARAYW